MSEECDEEEDKLLRDILISSATTLTQEEIDQDSDALWIEITDDGIRYSKGWVNFFRERLLDV